ncbi:hypothetical protein AKJ09_07564 [Labilithrix luteola]|uniref:DUF1385 domain-containing protein n=1 Tax=Labilithrix luteola TaxID=1391654 RepID=A0A0K1Q4Y9_9BACT|nr:hypothetical protein AKJ09_07564 [Labilithrix luteola]
MLEGVMMRSPTSFAVVVRRRDGSLHVREKGMPDGRTGAAKLPLVRGVASLVESLKLGGEALRFSAEQMERDFDEQEKEEAAKASSAAKKTGIGAGALRMLQAIAYTLFLLISADDGGEPAGSSGEVIEPVASPNDAQPEKEKASKGPMGLMLVVMVVFLIALPQAAAAGMNKLLKFGLEVQSPGFQAMTGAFKLTIVIGYLFVIRRFLPDIRRVFQYHGAEHKTISTYEANEPLTVANARAKTTLHPRCGTTFLVMVALVSILVFTAVGGFLPKIQTGKVLLDNVIFFAEKLPFLPLIAAVTFEIQRVFARYCTTGPLRVLLWPGFLCQKITTIEPDDEQLEVALASLRVTLFREEGIEKSVVPAVTAAGQAPAPADVRYRSFDVLMKSARLRRAA